MLGHSLQRQGPAKLDCVARGPAPATTPAMSEHVQIRLISLLEEATNSFEQLETMANRALREIPADHVDEISILPVERDVLDDENELVSEMDHLVFIRYRAENDTPAG